MNDVKENIRAMIKDETATKRREELAVQRSKKPKKSKKEAMDVEKKKLIKKLLLVLVLVVISAGLFFAASVTKESAEKIYQKQLEDKSRKQLNSLHTQVMQILNYKINNFNYILKDAEYIKNFNDTSWRSVLKTELESRLGDQAIVTIISADFKEDEIIDNPEMGYAVLSMLEELKKSDSKKKGSSIKIEVHRANSKDGRLILLQQVSYLDVEQKKDIVIGYIMARMPQVFLKELVRDFVPQSGYIELVQLFSGKASILVKRGNASLKTLPMVVKKRITNTPWMLKFWLAEQAEKPPVSVLWLAMVYLALGSLGIVSALVLLVLVLKNSRIKENSSELKGRKGGSLADTHDSKTVKQSKEKTNVIYRKDNGITLRDGDESKNEYLRYVADKIFRAYDIRGVVGEYINAEVFRRIACALAVDMAEQQQTEIAVACDGRNSSPELVQAVIEALLQSGINVMDIGMTTSPVLYFAALTKTNGNGLVVTASHNPGDHNGMKIMLTGHSYSDEHLQQLKSKMFDCEPLTGNGQLTKVNVMEDYMTKITGNIILARPMNIVIDTGNGVTGKFATTFFEQLGCKVTALNAEVDGNFPAHDPDPSRPENMSELIDTVIEMKADLGIAFDGDGDRIGLVSSGGEIIWPDRILMLLAKDILSRNKEATILYDVKSSWKIKPFISELGGTAIMCKSGHSFMKSKLLETGALLAGEMSGHIFIKERWFGFDDALFVAARVLEILSIDLRKSRQVFAEFPDSINTPEILIGTVNGPAIMQKLSEDVSCFSDGEVITIDGIRVEYSDGWGLVRASNTSDNLTMRFEADSEDALQRIATVFKDAILAVDPGLEFPF